MLKGFIQSYFPGFKSDYESRKKYDYLINFAENSYPMPEAIEANMHKNKGLILIEKTMNKRGTEDLFQDNLLILYFIFYSKYK
jgi:hypothetical protein